MLEGVELVVKSPGVPAESPLVAAARARGIPVWSEVELGYRLLPRAPADRRHRHERQDDDDRAARRDPPRGRPARRGRRQRRPRPHRRRRGCGGRLVDRLRALELPARGRPHARLRRRRPSQPRARPPRPPRHLRGVPRREAPHLRARAREGRAARLRDRRDRVLRRRSAAGGAAASPAATTARTPPLRPRPPAPPASPTTRSPRRSRTFAGVPHRLELVRELRGVRWVNDSKATNTAAARRGVAAYDAPLRLILGGSLKGEDFGPFARDLPANVRSIYLIGDASRRARRRARRGRTRVRPRRRPRRRPSRTPRRRRAGRRRPALAGVRELRPVRELRGARRHVPPPRRGARMSSAKRAPVRVEPARARHRRTRPLRARHGLQRDVGIGRARERQPARLSSSGRRSTPSSASRCSSSSRAPTSSGSARSRRASSSPRSSSASACSWSAQRINGARRWIDVGPLAFQPSELAKLALVVWAAAYLSRASRRARSRSSRRPIGLLVASLRGARPRRARPRDRDHDRARRRRDAARLGHAAAAARDRVRDRLRARRDRRVVVAVPPRSSAHLPRPVEGPDRHRPPERAGADQPRLGRHLRPRPRARASRRSTTSPRRTPT